MARLAAVFWSSGTLPARSLDADEYSASSIRIATSAVPSHTITRPTILSSGVRVIAETPPCRGEQDVKAHASARATHATITYGRRRALRARRTIATSPLGWTEPAGELRCDPDGCTSMMVAGKQELPCLTIQEGLNGFDFDRSSQEKRVENPRSSRKRSLETTSADSKRTDFALAA